MDTRVEQPQQIDQTTQVGRSIPRLEGRSKVTGAAEYIHNLRLPGMLYGKIFRSSIPHGRIRAIDTSAARALGGVHSVITGEDVRRLIPDPYYGPAFLDQPILALEKVRYAGEPVAVALASDPHVAEQAAALITADYEELPAVFDEVEAVHSKVIVHEELKPAGTFPDLKHFKGRKNTNVALDYRLRRGDVEKAFAEADHVFEHTFRTQQVMHTPLEPMVTLAEPGETVLTIHTASQMPSFVRSEIARLLGWPENRVRVRTAFLGGGFGAKTYIKLEALVAALSLLVRRPVKISLSMEEQFYTISKHPTTFRIKSGVKKDGRITARLCEVWWNGGAYADIGPRVTQKSGFTSAGPYDIENVHIDSYAVYTNLPPAAALRGFGIPQLVWAYESHTDLIARALGMDPLAFRRKNILRDGRPHATGTIMRDAEFDSVLASLEKRLDWQAPFDRGAGPIRRGHGLAIGFKASISPTTSVAIVNVAADGSCCLYCNTADMGQGSDTAMAQIVGEVLEMPAETVKVVHGDTDVAPYDMGTLGSRSTFHMGHAVHAAAQDARAKLHALALEVGLEYAPGAIAGVFQKKYGMQAGNVIG
ncbi:MAG: xanthine dehydrogenase family protein, partial [Betaproteobacteria bacterium]|nr:xanthine dehydrogenase family protein [Betaproteobacteria bacterium]